MKPTLQHLLRHEAKDHTAHGHDGLAMMMNNAADEIDRLQNGVLGLRVAELTGERDALKAQVEQFTMCEWREIGESNWAQCDKDWFEYCQKSPEHDTRKRLISAVDIKAEAAETAYANGFIDGYDQEECLVNPALEASTSANKYANQIRQSAKAGE